MARRARRYAYGPYSDGPDPLDEPADEVGAAASARGQAGERREQRADDVAVEGVVAGVERGAGVPPVERRAAVVEGAGRLRAAIGTKAVLTVVKRGYRLAVSVEA